MLTVKIYKVLNEHLESAFKLTTRPELHYRNRAYQWLEAITEVCPKVFWAERKRRTVKSIYTHAIEVAKTSGDEPHRESALKIALKFQEITKDLSFDDYTKTIRGQLLQILADDRRENFRLQIVQRI
jgi:hypothetical protein